MSIMVPLASAAQYLTSPAQNTESSVSMYLRQVQQSVAAGDQTTTEQQITAIQGKLRSADAFTELGSARLSSVQQYLGQVASQIRAGDLVGAEQALVTAQQYAAQIAASAK